MRHRTLLLGALLLSFSVGLVAGWSLRDARQEVVVPDVRGLQSGPASDLLHRVGLRVSFTQVAATSLPHRITVVGETPPPGTLVSPGATIQLRLRLGPVIPSPIG
jgi:beta-lactam-binding protein with PASTA domain